MSENINTVEYWNERFQRDWEKLSGDEQTVFFAKIAVELMPDWLINKIKEGKFSICDFGCATGQAVDYLYEFFGTHVSGADFSERAITRAREVYPQYEFWRTDIVRDHNKKMKFDVGYVSNVLEHIEAPWNAARNLTRYLNKYLIVLIPFRETMENEEHCNIFDLQDIPMGIADFQLVYAAYKDCALVQNTLYRDKQIMLIYSSEKEDFGALSLDSLVQSFEWDRNDETQCYIEQLLDKILHLNNEKNKLNQIIINKDAIIAQADFRLNNLQEKCNRFLDGTAELNQIVADKDEIIARADSRLNELQESCDKYLRDVTELNQIVADKNETIAEADSRLNALYEVDRELHTQIDRLEKQLHTQRLDSDYMKNMIYSLQVENERIKGTISWRLTKPLRFVGYCANCGKQMCTDHRYFYTKIRNSGFYKKYLKMFVPQKLKDRLMNRYFQTSEDIFIFENNDQERQALECLKKFENSLSKNDQLILVFSGVKYVDCEGQRNIRLIHEAKKMGVKIIFAYWRWGAEKELEPSEENMVKIPIDILSCKQVYFFENLFRNVMNKCLLVEFPHPCVTQIIEIAKSFGWKTVYDVIDDWEEFSKCGQAAWYRKEVERRVANIVDINIATAYGLRDKIRKDIVEEKPYYVITNGVDPDRMKRVERIPEYNYVRGNLQIGYFGHLTDAWFDWDMLKNIARKQPGWTFHIIGYGAPEHLELPDNIILYGKKPPEELPKFAAYWDVAIIPFINNELTRRVNPIKVFEYLQLRLPVVASDMPEIANYPYVVLAIGEERFQQAVADAARVKMDETKVDRFIEANTWKNKCREFLECINK